MSTLAGKKIAFIVANEGVEQAELEQPWDHFHDLGAEPVLVAPKRGKVQAFRHVELGDAFEATVTTTDAEVRDFAGVVLPGGVVNADALRTDAAAVQFVSDAVAAGIPIAVVCHGSWPMVEADVVRDRTLTSWPSLQTDLRNAGAMWEDQEVVVCTNGPNTIVSSRRPDDLPAFDVQAQRAFERALAERGAATGAAHA